MLNRTYQPADITAAAERATAVALPAVPASHRGRWQYLVGRRQLTVRLTNAAAAVALRLKTPLLRRQINKSFPGAVEKIKVQTGPAA